MKPLAFYTSLIIVLALAVLAFRIARPYIAAIVFGAVFAYWFYPLHKRLAKKLKPTGSAILLAVLVSAVLVMIVQYGIFVISRELSVLLMAVKNLDFSLITSSATAESWLSIEEFSKQISGGVYKYISNIIYALPHFIVSTFIFVISFFYFLCDGERIYDWIEKKAPLPTEKRQRIFSEVSHYINAFIKVQLFIGILQGVTCAVVFYLFGFKQYILIASLIAAVLSILPVIGPYLLYTPVGAVMMLQGNTLGGFGLLALGLAAGSFLDYVIRPQLTAKYAKIHPMIVLIGILGGMAAFGVVGIIIGPVILSVLVILIKELDLKTLLVE